MLDCLILLLLLRKKVLKVFRACGGDSGIRQFGCDITEKYSVSSRQLPLNSDKVRMLNCGGAFSKS